MKALVAAPATAGLVELREVAAPVPLPNEAVVDVRAISVNRGELHRLQVAADGWHPGWDVAGVVAHAASDGSGPPAGARVVGLKLFGGWAERVAIATGQLATIPPEVSFPAAATLPIAALTALRCLRLAGLLLGKRVLVTGAAGGVGRFAIQLAASARASVAGVVRSAERGADLPALGASEVFLESEVQGEYDLILDAAGGGSLAMAMEHVASGGLVVTYGNSSRERTDFLVNDFYAKRARLQGYFVLDDVVEDPAGRDLAYLASLVAVGELKAQIAFESDWGRAVEALLRLRDRALDGKAVLTIA